jgi:hypothetical protein
MPAPAITRTKAKQLGLELVRLLTMHQGVLRRQPPDQPNEALVYGLDGPQEQQMIVREGKRPPKTVPHKRSGLPIRPLCVHEGKVVRAVPIDWDWGVELMSLRAKKPELA